MLSLNPRRLPSFLGVAGLIDDPDAMRAGMLTRQDGLQACPQTVFVPTVRGQKFLQRSRWHPRLERYWLDALLRQIRQLPLNVDTQMFTCVATSKAIFKTSQVVEQTRR